MSHDAGQTRLNSARPGTTVAPDTAASPVYKPRNTAIDLPQRCQESNHRQLSPACLAHMGRPRLG